MRRFSPSIQSAREEGIEINAPPSLRRVVKKRRSNVREDKLLRKEEEMTLQILLDQLYSRIDKDKRFFINVVRGKVVDSFFRAIRRESFLPTRLMSVVFTNERDVAEGAVDDGGPRREMWTLLLREIEERFFEGPTTRKNLLLNANFLNEGVYFEVGRSIALSLVQEGPGPRFLAPFLFNSVADLPPIQPTIEDIGDVDIREKIIDISDANDVSKLQVALYKCSDLLGFCGLPPYVRNLSHKRQLIDNLISFYVVDRKRTAVEQLKRGLDTLGVLGYVKKWPDLFREVMCYGDEIVVKAAYMKRLFRIVRRGGDLAEIECRTLIYWWNFLDDCEGKSKSPRVGPIFFSFYFFFFQFFLFLLISFFQKVNVI